MYKTDTVKRIFRSVGKSLVDADTRCAIPIAPFAKEQPMPLAVLQTVQQRMDDFLVKWKTNMDRAGYLELTTAKREDCMLSFQWFLDPLCAALEDNNPPVDFYTLLHNTDGWADKILATAQRHRFRGLSAAMFFGCFKTLVYAVEEMVLETGHPREQKLAALGAIRIWADALETHIVGDWSMLSQREADARLDESNRYLTLEKNKYENMLGIISELVLVINAEGAVVEFNRAAAEHLSLERLDGTRVWEVLGLDVASMDELLQAYPAEYGHEIETGFSPYYFELHVAPLQQISLASSSYLLALRDISAHVRQREILEHTVQERTRDLEKEKAQLEEMNITLRQVLKNIDSELDKYKSHIARRVETILLPAVQRLRGQMGQGGSNEHLQVLEDQLLGLYAEAPEGSDPLLLKLSPTEMKICRQIQAGHSTKTIADALNMSEGTVQSHRKHIRKKLQIQNKNVNLYTYLQRRNAPAG